MQYMLCALCDTIIDQKNDSREHIIPNAIGGRKKISGFICERCNNSTGDNWESEIARQLNPLSLFFGITRERGVAPSQLFETIGGEKYNLHIDGSMSPERPTFKKNKIEGGYSVEITARNIKEAKKMLSGLKKKHPKIDTETFLDSAKLESSYVGDKLNFKLVFGGAKAGRSIVKTALSLVVDAGIDPKQCIHARNYLLNKDGSACFGYYYENDLVRNRPEGIPFHCVYVRGISKTKQILGYIEYFGMQRVVLCLSSTYLGEDFENKYSINPIDGSDLVIQVDLDFSDGEIQEIYNYEKACFDKATDSFNSLIGITLENARQKEQDRVIHKAVENALRNCGAKEGDTLTEEHIFKMTKLMMDELQPFLLHHIVGKPSSKSV